MAALQHDILETVQTALATHHAKPGALLPVLHDVQDRLAHIPSSAVPVIAAALNLSRAEVHGVITFYHHFRQAPPGKHILHVCRAEACQAVGASDLADHIRLSLGCDWHETTRDGLLTIEPAYCLGHCGVGPAIMVDDQPQARVTAARFEAIADVIRAGA